MWPGDEANISTMIIITRKYCTTLCSLSLTEYLRTTLELREAFQGGDCTRIAHDNFIGLATKLPVRTASRLLGNCDVLPSIVQALAVLAVMPRVHPTEEIRKLEAPVLQDPGMPSLVVSAARL